MSKFCPHCKKEFPDSYTYQYCDECSSCLVEKKAPGARNAGNSANSTPNENFPNGFINLGTAGAVSGGINTSIKYEAQKTEMEILQENQKKYLAACKRALEDNVLEQSEIIELMNYRNELNIDEATADKILESVRRSADLNSRKTSLNSIARAQLNLLKANLQSNNVNALKAQIGKLEAIVNKFEHAELSRMYYLALAVLDPERCIKLKESSIVDSYWKSYWSYLAYIKAGMPMEAEMLLAGMDRFADYPEDNVTILAIAGALLTDNEIEAREYLSAVTGEYTTELQRFVDSIYLLLEPETAKEMGANEESCAFYLTNLFGHSSLKEKATAFKDEVKVIETECTMPYSIDDDSGTFTGTVVDGIPVKGKFEMEEGSFEGEFKEGRPFRGVFIFSEGGSFEGELNEDGEPFSGIFKDLDVDGGKLTVTVVDGESSGYGRMSFPDGVSFEGEFKDSKPIKGVLTFSDGGCFEGELNVDGKPFRGTIKDVNVDGGKLTVTVVDGEYSGYGKMSFPEGGSFEGEFKDGAPFNGICNDYVSEGCVLTGRFVKGVLDGFGSIRFEDGSRFEGEIKGGQPFNGKMFDNVMEDGKRMDIKVQDGEPQIEDDDIWSIFEEAISKTSDEETTMPYTFNDLSGTFTGVAEDGKPIKGRVSFENDGSYEGEFKDGEPYDGLFTDVSYDDDGSTITVKIVDGQFRDGVISFADGSRFEGELDDGDPYDGMMFNYRMKDGSVVDSKVSKGKIEAVEEAKRQERLEAERKAKEEAERKAREAEKKAKEEARIKALRKQITYTLSIESITDPIQSMMTARGAFGWGVAEYRQKIAKLPVAVSTSEDLDEIQNLKSSLCKGGFKVEISAKNGLGEIVDLNSKDKKTASKSSNRKK